MSLKRDLESSKTNPQDDDLGKISGHQPKEELAKFVLQVRRLFRVKQKEWARERIKENAGKVKQQVALLQSFATRRIAAPKGCSKKAISIRCSICEVDLFRNDIKSKKMLRSNPPNSSKSALYCDHNGDNRFDVLPGQLTLKAECPGQARIRFIYSPLTDGFQPKVVAEAVGLEFARNVPMYTTWLGLRTNALLQEDTRRRLLYADNDGEMIAGSDSEESEANDDDHWGRGEDFCLQAALAYHGFCDETRGELIEALKMTTAACILVRCKELEAYQSSLHGAPIKQTSAGAQLARIPHYPSAYPDLNAAMDSFRTLFCRRCRIFDCRMHGCGQWIPRPAFTKLILPRSGSHTNNSNYNTDNNNLTKDCGPKCYLRTHEKGLDDQRTTPVKLKTSDHTKYNDLGRKRGKQSYAGEHNAQHMKKSKSCAVISRVNHPLLPVSPPSNQTTPSHAASCSANYWLQFDVVWSNAEVELFDYAYSLFGDDACRCSRFLATRTCANVRVRLEELKQQRRATEMKECPISPPCHLNEGSSHNARRGNRRKANLVTRRRQTGTTARWRLEHANDQVFSQYIPCSCEGVCTTTCGCVGDRNFCEKFCGCLSKCKNHFPGCNCLKGQCRTRACPCFAASRECDPDRCKKCMSTAKMVAYHQAERIQDSSHPGMPPIPDETVWCQNMKLQLGHHRHIHLGLSHVAGWGAFLNDGARKDEFLGEYTGELITQTEADRRGKVYDRSNCSFLFNLNYHWVLDARLRGNKLKFANHSAQPNCYAKVLMVDGDHRVGIFAKETIPAGSELFYDYRYEKDKAPHWAMDRNTQHNADVAEMCMFEPCGK
mmetsp:Transcript_37337/g.70119  ORF Transcript_37337/g.70119 Transcript_37337/m.70119 type:complete len:830 (-) Transcript_37337:333-2822(-)